MQLAISGAVRDRMYAIHMYHVDCAFKLQTFAWLWMEKALKLGWKMKVPF